MVLHDRHVMESDVKYFEAVILSNLF